MAEIHQLSRVDFFYDSSRLCSATGSAVGQLLVSRWVAPQLDNGNVCLRDVFQGLKHPKEMVKLWRRGVSSAEGTTCQRCVKVCLQETERRKIIGVKFLLVPFQCWTPPTRSKVFDRLFYTCQFLRCSSSVFLGGWRNRILIIWPEAWWSREDHVAPEKYITVFVRICFPQMDEYINMSMMIMSVLLSRHVRDLKIFWDSSRFQDKR